MQLTLPAASTSYWLQIAGRLLIAVVSLSFQLRVTPAVQPHAVLTSDAPVLGGRALRICFCKYLQTLATHAQPTSSTLHRSVVSTQHGKHCMIAACGCKPHSVYRVSSQFYTLVYSTSAEFWILLAFLRARESWASVHNRFITPCMGKEIPCPIDIDTMD